MTTTACSRCNAALAAGAQFCGSCGAPQNAGPTPPPPPIPQPPPYPTPPPMPQMQRGFSGGSSGGGASQQATFNGEPADAYNQAINALNALGAQVLWQQPPTSAKFLLAKKDTWITSGFAMKYDGDLNIQKSSPAQTTARVSLKLQWGSFLPLGLTWIAVVLALSMFNLTYATYLLFFMIVFVGYSAWQVSSQLPEKIAADFFRTLGGAPAAAPQQSFTPQPQPAPQQFTPAPQPAAPSPTPAPAPAPSNGGDAATIMEQIKQLGSLRDAGVLTPEEFEAKKAELLKRI